MSRERVCRQLKPPISAKTLERWEAAGVPARSRWQLPQLAAIYAVELEDLNEKVAA